MIHNNFFFIAHTLFLLTNFSLTTLMRTLVRRSVLFDPRTKETDCHTSDIGHSLQVLGDIGAVELVRALAGSQ
jgi:hypothetical protein